MESIYLQIYELARSYYEKGRAYDLYQISWMLKQVDLFASKINLNKKILIPLVILHDIGYAFIENKNPNIKDPEFKKIHMKEGVKIARKILKKIKYNKKLSEKILYYISIHDNWVLGDDKPYKKSKLLSFFNDLDFLHAQSNFEALKYAADSRGISIKNMYDLYLCDEKHIRRPFCCKETKKLFKNFMNERKKELNNISKK